MWLSNIHKVKTNKKPYPLKEKKMDVWKTSDFRTKSTDVVLTQMGLYVGMMFDKAH